jgi:Ser/Thr protein kinase RdoA (MazF antagonist)
MATEVYTASETILLPLIQKAFPTAVSYEIDNTIVQANAVGYKLTVALQDEALPYRTLFLKHVLAETYVSTKNDWNDLRRTLLYGRTEARFYASFVPLLRARGFDAVPHAYVSEYALMDWIHNDERATQPADSTVRIEQLPHPNKTYGLLILECVSDHTHMQESPLSTQDQCRACLRAVAILHAAAWQDVALLKRAEAELGRASFHLDTRNPRELAGVEQAWSEFMEAFGMPFAELGLEWTDSLRRIGSRVKKLAQHVSNVVSPLPTDKYATIIHGDFKAMNVFLPRNNDQHTLLVDFASTGLGLGMSDLAMHIHHAVRPELLHDCGGDEAFVKYYWQELTKLIDTDYAWDDAWRHYKYAVVDYFRFFLARMWKGATPESMNRKKDNQNVSLINRDIPAACAFLKLAQGFLIEIEKEVYGEGFVDSS